MEDEQKAEDIRIIKQAMMDKFGVKSISSLGEGGEGEVYKIGDFVVKIIPFLDDEYEENTFHRAQFVKEMEFWNRFFPKKSILSRIRNAVTCRRRGVCGQKPLTLIDFLPKYIESKVWDESTTFTYGVIVFQYEYVMDMHNYIHTYYKKIPYKRGTEIFNNLVKGFQLLHEAGYAHVDIKPSNILIRNNSNIPIIIDFGFMCKLEECDRRIGTYSYIPKVMRPYFIDPDDWLEEGNSREKKNPLKLKMGANTDKYSLALTLGQWMTNIDWSGGPPGEKGRYSAKIRELQAPLRRRIKNTRRNTSRAKSRAN
jgi:serine/threonine protein kinase